MENKSYKLSEKGALAIPAAHADKLIASGDASAALVYLCFLRAGGELSLREVSLSLGLAQEEAARAAKHLEELGLLSGGSGAKPLPPADALPEYPAEEVAARSRSDPAFTAVVEEVQSALGRLLSGTELKTLFGIYDYLGFPAEVLMLLVHYCIDRTHARYGPGRMPTMRTIEKEAYTWANREILTLEQAEAYLRSQQQRTQALGEICRVLQIQGRALSATERRYVDSWIDMGFGAEALAIAYDRTVVKTGGLKWAYMNSIVQSWHDKGLHTPAEIEAGDVPPAGRRSRSTAAPRLQSAAPRKGDLERMQKIYEKLKG